MDMDAIICEMISRETIKPSSPTPQHLRIFKLSWLDQVSARLFVPILLLFDKTSDPINKDLLKTSLSQTLSKYYPFAGRLRDRQSILCNDDGVEFLEAKVNVRLSFLLQNPRRESLEILFPDKLHWRYAEGLATSLLVVQVSHFCCGGWALGVCASHKLADAATLVTFVSTWASVARDCLETVSFPEALGTAAELFPTGGDLPLLPEPIGPHSSGSFATRRFVFNGDKIGFLKAVSLGGATTRVEAVTALLYKTAIRASKAVSGSDNSHYVLLHQVNLRRRVVPELPENAFGSLVWCFPVAEGSQIREALTRFCGAYFERFRRSHEEWFLAMRECMEEFKASIRRSQSQTVLYTCTSWCRFGVYEVDFGWGNPVWATSAGTVDKNVVILMDTKSGDGIEAIVTLDEQEMFVFQCDQELLQFASLLS